MSDHQVWSAGTPAPAFAIKFEHIAPISGEDAEELEQWFTALIWMITMKDCNDKLGRFTAAMLGRLMLAKLSQHSKAYDQLTAILTVAYCQRWDSWTGEAATPVPAAAAPAPAATQVQAVLPVGDRMLAMIEDVREKLSQQLGHKMDHRRKAWDYQGCNPDTGKPYPTPSGVMRRAKVLLQLVVRAGVKDLPESTFAWRMVEVLGNLFPMHGTNLGDLIRTHVMTLSVDADDLTLEVVSTAADKYYDTWRTYDNCVDKGGVARGAAPAGSVVQQQQHEQAAGNAQHAKSPHGDHSWSGSDQHNSDDGCEEPKQQQPRVNAVADWAPNPDAAPSEAGTVISMADLRSVLQEMGVSRGATPAVNMAQHQPSTSVAPSTAGTVISMADLRTVLKEWGY